MRIFCICLQYVGIFFLIVELVYTLRQWPSRPQSHLLFLLLATLLNSIGYLFEISAVQPEVAFAGTRLSYVGKAYIPMITLLFVADYCKVKLPRILPGIMLAVHSLILLLVLTCEYHTLYYTEVGYDATGVFPHLVLGHGPVYKLYMAVLLFCTFSVLAIVLYRYRTVKDAEEKRRVLQLFLIVLLPPIGLVLFLLGISHGYDTTALSYVISSALLLISTLRNNFFETLNLAKDHVIENLSDGLVVVGTENELVYTNPPAQSLYPALTTETYSGALEEIRKSAESQKEICLEDRIYLASRRDILHNHSLRGSIYLFKDITEERNYSRKLQREVDEKTKEIRHIQHSVIASFANMVEARDGVTGLHIKHTSAYVGIVAHALQKREVHRELLTDAYVTILIEAAPLHDIGKIAIPDSILMKPGKFSEEEFAVMQTHAKLGADIIEELLVELEDSEYLSIARDMAYCHHEKWNGSGYPNGLKGEEIPLCARIMAIADVYDALRSKRSYKDEFPSEKAKSIIAEGAGTHFDPEVVEAFLENIWEIEAAGQGTY